MAHFREIFNAIPRLNGYSTLNCTPCLYPVKARLAFSFEDIRKESALRLGQFTKRYLRCLNALPANSSICI